jgi:amidohydrolase
MKENLNTEIQNLARKLFPEIREWRRHIHAHPELSFEEKETARFVAGILNKLGIPFRDKVAGTGIVAEIHGNTKGDKVFALRADLDALPIQEKNEIPYASKIPGRMHACGHDVHTAVLLGAAAILAENKNSFNGTVRLIFQPGEEKLPGGASLMIAEGVLENPVPSGILALHVFPSMEVGKAGFRQGMYMASTDELYLEVKGKGGHAAMRNEYVNPLLITAEILKEVENKFALNLPKDAPQTVVAFGKIEGQGSTNIIPDSVLLEGTFRTLDEKWRHKVHTDLIQLCESTAHAMGGKAILRIESGYPALLNDEDLTGRIKKSAETLLGKENVEELPLRMTAEDFAWYTHKIPGCFFRLGTGNSKLGITSGVHTPTFDIDENALITGASLMAWAAISELSD